MLLTAQEAADINAFGLWYADYLATSWPNNQAAKAGLKAIQVIIENIKKGYPIEEFMCEPFTKISVLSNIFTDYQEGRIGIDKAKQRTQGFTKKYRAYLTSIGLNDAIVSNTGTKNPEWALNYEIIA